MRILAHEARQPSTGLAKQGCKVRAQKTRRGNERGCVKMVCCCPHPEESWGARRQDRTANSKRAYALLEGWGRAERPHASRRIAARPWRWKDVCSRRAAMLLSMRAGVQRSRRSRARRQVRWWNQPARVSGALPLFWDCYLQWKYQLKIV